MLNAVRYFMSSILMLVFFSINSYAQDKEQMAALKQSEIEMNNGFYLTCKGALSAGLASENNEDLDFCGFHLKGILFSAMLTQSWYINDKNNSNKKFICIDGQVSGMQIVVMYVSYVDRNPKTLSDMINVSLQSFIRSEFACPTDKPITEDAKP
jgi:hypothetical protein